MTLTSAAWKHLALPPDIDAFVFARLCSREIPDHDV